ncbi:MAG: glucose-1-phosphate adenylyltransferase subunit GlgD, partial [Defluviitaleaceae bacterium]|nr:glucose-1-phosphate adenylyltransferase subunit GlgD [Defluviitaleaceae bacterium]
NERLGRLTDVRATSAMPVGSCYRAIDFSLSNMSNSGIKKVAVITQFNSRSLHDHLNSPKWWDFGTKRGGLFVLSPFQSKEEGFWFRGTADSMYQNMAYLERSSEEIVVIASGDGVYKMDYNKVIEAHIESGADVTVVCKILENMDLRHFGVLSLGENGRIVDFQEKPEMPQSNTISLGIYVIRRKLLMEMLEQAFSEDRYDFVKEMLVANIHNLHMHGYMFNEYWSAINTIESYFNINMDFLRPDVREHFYNEEPYIETKNKDEPPAKYGEMSSVRNSLIGSGSVINGDVRCSVLFRRVRVSSGARVRRSILMEGCKIGANCCLENVILDKNVVISKNTTILGGDGPPKIVMRDEIY